MRSKGNITDVRAIGDRIAGAILIIAIGCATSSNSNSEGREDSPRTGKGVNDSRAIADSFTGRLLLAISDGEMTASAYVDGRLHVGSRDTVERDILTAIKLPIKYRNGPDREISVSETEVPNSVIGSPFALAISGSRDEAYVLESFGSPLPSVRAVENVFESLPSGSTLRSVDIRDPVRLRVVDQLYLGEGFHTVDVHPTEEILGVCSDTPGKQIGLVRVRSGGEFGEPVFFPLRGVEDPEAPTGNLKWHPNGRFLAVTLTMLNAVAFFEVSFSNSLDGVELIPWGAPVEVGKFPYSGIWTPDGRHFITTDDQWGNDVPGFYFDPPPGQLTVVRFDADELNGSIRHEVVSTAGTDISPDGIAISPDGKYVVTANLVRSFMPWDHPLFTQYSSLSFLRLNPHSGEIRHICDYRLKGILPESVTFDSVGQSLAVIMYDRFDPRNNDAAIQFWSVVGGEDPELIPSGYSISVSRGGHALALIPSDG